MKIGFISRQLNFIRNKFRIRSSVCTGSILDSQHLQFLKVSYAAGLMAPNNDWNHVQKIIN